MGRHLVFFNCSYSMANAVATRLLTGMILSGSWVCFEVAHNLPQTMLSTLGKYLGCIKESYKCLAINKSNEYFSRVTGKADGLKDAEKVSVYWRELVITEGDHWIRRSTDQVGYVESVLLMGDNLAKTCYYATNMLIYIEAVQIRVF